MAIQPAQPDYVLGRSEQESQRLVKQSIFVRPSTERVFRKAGIAAGMRVLDIGCGAGDVSFLAAELVGETGSVIGVDRDPGVLALARRRAKENGLTNVTFEEREIDDITPAQPHDAVVSRFVLMYQADPVATLARLARTVRKGGLVVVQEPDFGVGITAWPTVELWQKVSHWMRRGIPSRWRASRHRRQTLSPLSAGRVAGPMLLQHVTVAGGADDEAFLRARRGDDSVACCRG